MRAALQWWQRRGWPIRILLVLIALYLVYVLVVFFLLPGVVQSKAEDQLSHRLGRDVTIEQVSLNPFTVSATVEGFAVADPQTTQLIGFQRLYVNVGVWASLFHWRPWISDIVLSQPDLRVRHDADGSLNIDDVLVSLQETAAQKPPQEKEPESKPLPAMTVARLSVDKGAVQVTNAAGKEPITVTLPVDFQVDGFTTRKPEEGQNRYVLDISGPDGGTLAWTGDFQLQPLGIKGHLELDGVHLTEFASLVRPLFRFRLPSGKLAVAGDYQYAVGADQGLTIQDASLNLTDLEVTREGGDQPSLVFPAIAVTGIDVHTGTRKAEVSKVAVDDAVIRATRDAGGLDLATLFTPKLTKRHTPASEATPVDESTPDVATTQTPVATIEKGEGAAAANDADRGPGRDSAEETAGADVPAWDISLDKLAINGVAVSLRDNTSQQPAAINLGSASVSLSGVGFDGQALSVQDGAVSLKKLDIGAQNDKQPSLAFPAIAVNGISLNTGQQRLDVPDVTVTQPAVRVVRTDEGLDLAQLFLPGKTTESTPTGQRAQDEKASTGPISPWDVTLEKLTIRDGKAALRDETLDQAADLKFTNTDLTVSDVTVGQTVDWKWQGSTTLLGSGHLQHQGQGQLAPLKVSASFDLDDLPLAALQPWIATAVPLNVTGGSAHGQIKLSVQGEQPDIAISGNAGVKQLAVQQHGQPLIRVAALDAKGLDVDTGKHLAAVNYIAVNHLDFINRIDKDGVDALSELTAGDSDSPTAGDSGPSWRVKLNAVEVHNSQLAHQDQSLSPAFKVSVQDLNGSLKGFDTAGGKARLKLAGKVNGNAPLQASGTVAPDPLFVDLVLSLSAYGMDTLTPYTGRYLGYAVQRGLLSVNSKVKISKGELDSTTNIDADRFYLGDKVSSDQAIDVPIKLGLAVMRDSSGKIALPLSVSGNMSDPDFTVSGVVLRVIKNVLVKAATAPFSLLANLVGGEKLDQIGFPPGDAAPAAETRQKLASLAQVLKERPNLAVEIAGTTNGDDRAALAQQALIKEMGDDWPGIDQAAADGGWFGWRSKIFKAYQKRLDKDPKEIAAKGEADAAETERARQAWQQMIAVATKQVAPDALSELAQQRAQAAQATLVKEYDIDAKRLTLGQADIDGKKAGVHLGLGRDK